MVWHLFDHMESAGDDIEFTMKVSAIEIYMEKIRDLFDGTWCNGDGCMMYSV